MKRQHSIHLHTMYNYLHMNINNLRIAFWEVVIMICDVFNKEDTLFIIIIHLNEAIKYLYNIKEKIQPIQPVECGALQCT